MQCGDCDTAVPGEAQSETDEACEEICSHCEKCEEDEEDELPLPSCYMPRGDDGPDYDPDKHVWEFRVSCGQLLLGKHVPAEPVSRRHARGRPRTLSNHTTY